MNIILCSRNRHSYGNLLLRMWGVSGALALFLFCSASAWAQKPGTVDVGGEYVLTVRHPSGGMSVRQRADAITERLTTILGDPNIRPGDIRAQARGRNMAVVKVKDRLLVTIDRQAAREFDQTPLQRARSLAVRLRRVLPKINVKPNPNLHSIHPRRRMNRR